MESYSGFGPLPTDVPNGNSFGGFERNRYGNSSNFRGFNDYPGAFTGPTDNSTTAPMLLGLGGAFLFITLCLLTARLWSRLRPWTLSLDDGAVLGAVVLAITQYSILGVCVLKGLGRRSRFVSPENRFQTLRLLWISQLVWYWSITLVKISVALLLLRFKRTKRWRFFLFFLMALSVLAVIVQTCFQFLQCRPFSAYWDFKVASSGRVRCFNVRLINGEIVAFSAVHVSLDLTFSFIPITFIRKLQRPRREKICICFLMGLGLFASCAAIARTSTLIGYGRTTDVFRYNVMISLWAIIEQQIALIAAILPTLKAFMEMTLVRIGLFFYDETTEQDMRDKLVDLGLLGAGEKLERDERTVVSRGSNYSTPWPGTGGSSRSVKSASSPKKTKDEFGDGALEGKAGVFTFEDMLLGKKSDKRKDRGQR